MTATADPVLWQFSLSTVNAIVWITLLLLALFMGLRLRWGKLVAITAFLTLDLLAFGAFVRLTDSGLGCPDWPGCYGKLLPTQAKAEINQAIIDQGSAMGAVNHSKAWIEMLHRYVASFIGALILVMLVRAVLEKMRRPGRELFHSESQIGVAWPLLLLIVVSLQGLFGKWTVTLKLMPVVVTTHLLGGMFLFALLIWFWMRERDRANDPAATAVTVTASVKVWVWFALLVLFGQIFLGGWVSTNYAVVACPDFPACNGSFMPPVDWANGFQLMRQLGINPDGSYVNVDGLRAIHWAHRLGAVLTTVVIVIAALKVMRAHPALKRNAIAIKVALLLQIIIGISTVMFSQPLLVATAHNFFAAVLLATLVVAAYRAR